jgi:hypothetical protein
VEVFFTGGRNGLLLAGKRAERRHQPCAAAAVVAGAEDFDFEGARRVGGDHDVESLAGSHALARAVAFDVRRPKAADFVETHARQLPVGRTGLGVFVNDGIGFLWRGVQVAGEGGEGTGGDAFDPIASRDAGSVFGRVHGGSRDARIRFRRFRAPAR